MAPISKMFGFCISSIDDLNNIVLYGAADKVITSLCSSFKPFNKHYNAKQDHLNGDETSLHISSILQRPVLPAQGELYFLREM